MKSVLIAALVLVSSACNKSDSEPGGTYTVRGVVKALQTSGPGDVQIQHESIPDFVDREGNEVGMMSMEMPFGVKKGVSLEGIEPGDKVEITFETHWKARPVSQIKAIEELPADTELNLGEM